MRGRRVSLRALRRPAVALYVAAAVLLAGAFLAMREVYLLDLPAWLYQGAVFVRKVAGEDIPHYALKPYPVPNAAATVLFAAAVPALGPHGAAKLWVVGHLAAAFAVAYALARTVEPAQPVARAAVVVSVLFLSWSFWSGYLNFQMGLLGAAALAARWRRHGPLAPLGTAAASVALFFTHFIPFAVFAGAAGLDALRRRDGRTLGALAPSAALTGWYVLGRMAGPVSEGVPEPVYAPAGWGQALLYRGYTVLKLGPFQHFAEFDGRGFLEGVPALYWTLLALSMAFMAALLTGLALGVVRLARTRDARRGWALAATAVFFGGLLLPAFAFSIVNPGERVVAMGLLGLLAVVPLPRRLLTGLALATLLFAAYGLAYLVAHREGLPPETRARYYAERRAREAAPPPPEAHVEAFRDPHRNAVERLHADTRLKYLTHTMYYHAPLYEALARGDYTLRSFGTGLLAERDLPR
ncbi:MAG TPA: hypothetical protein VD962_00525 [Rubricoccaceae bacterium]|nr:hypothetical protein [Rubricoccaceae bacterium]